MGAYGPSSVTPHKNVLLPVELWDTDVAYTELSVVFYNGSLWVAAADNDASAPSISNTDWTLAVSGYPNIPGVTTATEVFTILHPALRSLNTFPVTLVTPPTATSIVVPLFVYEMATAGGVAFSNSITPLLNIDASGSLFSLSNMLSIDGLVPVSAAYNAGFDLGDTIAAALDYSSSLGTALFLSSSQNETGGDGTVLTLILTYQIVETAGLI